MFSSPSLIFLGFSVQPSVLWQFDLPGHSSFIYDYVAIISILHLTRVSKNVYPFNHILVLNVVGIIVNLGQLRDRLLILSLAMIML